MANILLLGAGGNAGINYTKCMHMTKLGGVQQHTIVGADMNRYYLDSCNADVRVRIDYDDKLNSILSIIKYLDIDMIHAQPDPEVKWLLSQPELAPYIFPHSLEIWEKFSDKLYCQSIWSKSLRHFAVASYKDTYQYPPLFAEMFDRGQGRVWVRALKGAGSKAALPVTTMEQAQNWVSYWREARGMDENDFMFCQYLPGREYAVQTLWKDGELVHSQCRERVAYFFGALMPSGQTSTPSVAKISNNGVAYHTAYKAIKLIDEKPNGIYCVDLKEDDRGYPIPMEVNYGRFFTTVDFFAKLGVNSPQTYTNMFFNKDIKDDYAIESVKKPFYWLRGLDKEPTIVN